MNILENLIRNKIFDEHDDIGSDPNYKALIQEKIELYNGVMNLIPYKQLDEIECLEARIESFVFKQAFLKGVEYAVRACLDLQKIKSGCA